MLNRTPKSTIRASWCSSPLLQWTIAHRLGTAESSRWHSPPVKYVQYPRQLRQLPGDVRVVRRCISARRRILCCNSCIPSACPPPPRVCARLHARTILCACGAPSARTCTASRVRQARRPRAYTARLHVARYMLHVMLLMLPTCCQCSYVVGGRVDRALQRFESLYAPAASRAFKSDRAIARCHIECRCSNAAKSVSVKSARLPLQQASESVSMRRTALNLDTVRELPKMIPLHHCRAQPL